MSASGETSTFHSFCLLSSPFLPSTTKKGFGSGVLVLFSICLVPHVRAHPIPIMERVFNP